MTAVEVRAVTMSFGDVVAVRDVSLAVGPGHLIAVTGPTGAGKTTLLNVLGGVLRPSAGDVLVDGTPLADRDDAVRRHIVLVPQGNALVRMLTALENVLVPLELRRRRQAVPTAERALGLVGLGEATGQLVDELSGGQQQRLALARALAEGGDVVVADEPTSELDATNRALAMSLLRAEAERGAAVVVATHDPEAANLADAELHLDQGVATWVRDDR